jgi:DNA gyrase subunit B
VARRIGGDALRRAVRLLSRLKELVGVAERRGVLFPDLLAARAQDPLDKGRLPTHRLTWTGGEAFAWSEEEGRATAAARGIRIHDVPAEAGGNAATGAPLDGAGTASGAAAAAPADQRPVAAMRELHENRELERLFEQLAKVGLSIEDYTLEQSELVTGEAVATKFAWELTAALGATAAPAAEDDAEPEDPTVAEDEGEGENASGSGNNAKGGRDDKRPVEAGNLPAIIESLHELGRRGVQVSRFKGLGEMNSEELWETTMDPTRRTLSRVTWDVASDAERLFSILMGENVEERRRFIEEHALEVKNLDV